MSKDWTKGPWVWLPYKNKIVSTQTTPGAGRIVDGLSIAFKGSDERDANAHLIAAAPELYDALEETLAIAERNEQGDFAVRARAALAKARGES